MIIHTGPSLHRSASHNSLEDRIISLSCARLRAGCTTPRRPRTPTHGYPAWGLEVTSASRPRGGPAGAQPPSGRRTGRPAGHEGALGLVVSGDRVQARGWVTRWTPGAPS